MKNLRRNGSPTMRAALMMLVHRGPPALPAVALPMMPPASHSCIDIDARLDMFSQHGKEMGE